MQILADTESGWLIGSVNTASWAKWSALAIGVPLVGYWVLKDTSSHLHPNDFDRFLVQESDHPTGLPQATASVKKKKKDKSRGWWSWGRSRVSQHERGQVSGPFETFLKVEEADTGGDDDGDDDHRDPVDFNSFLKAAIPANETRGAGRTPSTQQQQQQGPSPPPGPKSDQARVLVMYGTEFGFSKEIAEKLCDKLREAKKYWPVLEDMAEHPEGYDFRQEQALLIACSTQGDGVPPTEPRDFCEWLMAGKAGSLPHMSFSVCALGDKSYQHYCRCGKLLDAALASAGATCIAPRQDVNKEDWAAVHAWMDAAIAGLDKLNLEPVGEEAAAAMGGGGSASHAEHKPKKWSKSRPYPARVIAVEPLCNVTNKNDKVTVRVEVDVGTASGLGNYTPGDSLGLFAPNSTETVNELLAAIGAQCSLPVPVPSWHYAEDPDEEGMAGCAHGGTLPLQEALQKCYDLRLPKAELFNALWSALPEGARQKAEQGTGFVGDDAEACASSGNEEAQAAVLKQLLAGGSSALEAYFDYTGRNVADVLHTFPSAKISVSQLLGGLRALQPRLYSISSSPLEGKGCVQATIAEVRYEAFGKTRTGVASAHVSSCLKPGDRVRAYIHKNPDFRLPADLTKPIIMVGPGTGLAPFRAFILHRLLSGPAGANDSSSSSGAVLSSSSDTSSNGNGPTANGHTTTHVNFTSSNGNGVVQNGGGKKGLGQMVLFFGCRRRDQDYLYGKDLDAWAEAGAITLFNAFSREQMAKVYVQDRLRAQADLIWDLISEQGAHFYVCGDASSMAGAVEKELLSIFEANLTTPPQAAPGATVPSNTPVPTTPASKKNPKRKAAAATAKAGMVQDGAAAAKQYLEKLAASGRYQRDVWYT